ncbi:YDG/SRA domain-containing protein [Herbiconiux moechotypicola]|uniref:ScoMcrA-like SRA domain-containing protein n=1 Tax=Herbiconiux moechotypicola TaxID=637393 RepID=A0ABN3D926_9MICO|nr:YDG/SRA domain-containing protein [Herbiconiux moechotypicola]MCS5728139.1 YDG/SRA domain-containing protein [Herbiconiux moechotypicola]
MTWTIQIGEMMTRRAVHALYGGQQQQGISTPAQSSNILVFTDPAKGVKYGYDLHEGAREDGIYAYTGEGRIGPQTLTRGNLALLDSPRDGKTIRLFRTKDTHATYVGAFTLDDPPFEWRDIPDVMGDIRQGIIFSLAPLDADLKLVPPLGRERILQIQSHDWSAPGSDDYLLSPISQPGRIASRIEFELQSDFGSWRRAMGHDLQRKRIPVGTSFVEPDLFDSTTSELFEAKKSAARKCVRAAIGQVLDYTHNANRLGLTARPAILLPGSPDEDLLSLCDGLGIAVYARDGSTFSKLTAEF